MFHFGTTNNQERRDGFVSFRCFLLLGERGGERNLIRGGGWERTERMGTGLRGGGGERTLRGGKRTERMGTGTGIREGRTRDFEEGETRTQRRTKTGL